MNGGHIALSITIKNKKMKSEQYFTITLKKEDWRTILRGLKAESDIISDIIFLGATAEHYEQYHTEIAQIQKIIKDKMRGTES